MKARFRLLMFALALIMAGCESEVPGGPDGQPAGTETGTIEFDFPIPQISVPERGLHRIDLSLAASTYDLYRGDFIISANVSDEERTYTFRLDPGDYYYQAGITCSCLGDTCLWGGFPGGRFGAKWDMGKITIVKGETLTKTLIFK
jgi:hypothetical protein